jgi:hypothetical protein
MSGQLDPLHSRQAGCFKNTLNYLYLEEFTKTWGECLSADRFLANRFIR